MRDIELLDYSHTSKVSIPAGAHPLVYQDAPRVWLHSQETED